VFVRGHFRYGLGLHRYVARDRVAVQVPKRTNGDFASRANVTGGVRHDELCVEANAVLSVGTNLVCLLRYAKPPKRQNEKF
jgi:hypothetical protein